MTTQFQNSSGYQPLDVRVLVLPDEAEKKTAGGIYIPETAQEKAEWATTKATLVAVGSNAFLEWGDSALKPGAGSRVVMAQYAGRVHEGADGKKYRICNDADILALLED